jgi:hypothetical protein
MNRLNHRFLTIAICFFALAIAPALAQTVTQLVPEDLPVFNRISLGGDFALELHYGKQFRVQVDVEELYADYVLLAVEDSMLNVSVDSRRVPGDVRRLYRGREGVPAVFRVSVTMPEVLTYLRLSENAALSSADDLVFDTEEFALRATDNARTAGFSVRAGRVSVDLDKKSGVSMQSESDTLFVRMAGNANLELAFRSDSTVVNSVSNASLLMDGETERMEVHLKGTSKAILNGRSDRVDFDLVNSTNVNAISLACREAHAVMNGICSLSLSVTDDLYVDMNHGASLYFLNEPNVHVQYIKNSSLMPYDRK